MSLRLPKKMPQVELNEAEQIELEQKAVTLKTVLQKVATEFAPACFASSLSAEDMVLTNLILKENINIEIFTLDTGRLPEETYQLMQRIQAHYGVNLTVYYPEEIPLQAWVNTHGINAFYESVALRQACCYLRKVAPLKRALAGKKAWITGMRSSQSVTRANLEAQVFDADNNMEKFNPLAAWETNEVWAYIQRQNVPYHALHAEFYPSIGCAPCTRAISVGEDLRAGRWWWEDQHNKECGLHVKH